MQTQPTAQPSRVPGRIDVTRVDIRKVDSYLEKYKLKQGGEEATRVNRLQEYFYKLQAEDDADDAKLEFGTCSECNAESLTSLPECPFCGDPAEVQYAEEEPSNGHAPPVTAQVRKPPKRSQAPAAPAKPEKKAAAAPSKPAKAAKSAPPPKPQAKADKPAKAAPHAGNQALAAAPVHPLAVKVDKKKVDQLNAFVKSIRELKDRGAENLWKLGKELARIRDTGVWRSRMVPVPNRKDTYVPAHTNFKRFIEDELHISHLFAEQWMAVAERYSLAETKRYAGTSGTTHLRISVGLPPDKARAMLESGATSREMAEERARQNGVTRPPAGRTVTAILLAGQSFHPALALVGDGKPPKPAMRIQDEPYCVVQGENDTRIRVQLARNPQGAPGFSFVFTVTRGKDSAPAVVDESGEAVEEETE